MLAGSVAFYVDVDDDPDPPEVVVYCPMCAAREFGRVWRQRGR